MAYIGRTTDGFGVRQRFLFTPDAGATSVSGTDANGATLTFSDSVYMDVFLNGVLLKAGTDYNTNTANTIAGLTATVANDEVTVLVYDIFTTADMVSATSGGTFTGNVTHSGDLTINGTTTLSGPVTFDSSAPFYTISSNSILRFRDSGIGINSSADGQLDIDADTEVEITTTTVDLNGALDVSGATTAAAITASGIIKTDDTTDATSTTDGSLQTDGGLSVVKDAVFGDDIKLLSDSSVIHFGADSEVTLTHVADTGLLLNDKLSISTADNDDTLELISTDADASGGPALRFYRNSSSPADDDTMTTIRFEGNNDNSQVVVYNRIRADISDASDGTEDGIFNIFNMTAGTERTMFSIKPDEVVINEEGQDVDFRVEVSGKTHALYVDSTNASVCIGADIADYATTGASDLVVGNTNNEQNGITIVSGASSGNSTINFSDSNSGEGRRAGHINYQHQYDEFQIYNNNVTQLLRISSVGNIIPHHYIKQTNATTAGGTFVNGTNITGYNSGNYNEMNSDDNDIVLILNSFNSGGNKGGLKVQHANDTSNTTSKYFEAVNSTGNKALIFGNGDFDSATNSYGATSDERLKSDIVDAKSQWDDIKNIKFKNFKKHDTGDLVQLGVIAQEVEKTSPSLISEHEPSKQDITHDSSLGTLYTETDKDNDDIPDGRIVGDVKEVKEKVKGVKYSVLYMKAVKALQEAMARIETLEAEVKALKEA
jgi:hypothetical protein